MSGAELSVIVPAFNEAAGLASLADRLRSVLSCMDVTYEILIVNDGSSDGTEVCLEALSRDDRRIRAVNLARNFGKEAAMAAGLASAAGRCIVFIDADLQHPPDLIPRMYAAWRRGSDVVNAVKRQRASESVMYRWFANRFNGLMSSVIGRNMAGASDFKLIDRQVAEVLLECPERNRFFRGLVAWVGFRVESVEFDVVERELGTTKWSVGSLIRYSLANIVAFSSLPLVAVAYVGFLTAALGLLLLVQALFKWAMGTAVIGFTTVIAVQVLLGGMILTALGVIAIYLAKMYDEQKRRPLFVIRRPRESSTSADPLSPHGL
jgi:dolichol-phosphate mannosyltransferase